MPVRDVLQRLRPLLGPSKRRARNGGGLPAVQLRDGTMAEDPCQARDRWIEYFSEAESGVRCPAETIAAACHQRQQLGIGELPDIPPQEVPSRALLESVLRAAAPARAPAPDRLQSFLSMERAPSQELSIPFC